MANTKKLLIIGSKAFTMSTEDWLIDSFAWDEVDKIQNPYDYHTLVISLLGICDDDARNNVEWNKVWSKLTVPKTWHFLKCKGTVIVVGDPTFYVRTEKRMKVPFLWWTGFRFAWDNSPGDTKRPSEKFAFVKEYMQRLQKWKYSLKDVQIDPSFSEFTRMYLKEENVRLQKRTFFENRSKFALAFLVCFQMPGKIPGRPDLHNYTGPVIFLPEINATEKETLMIVSRDLCDIEILTPEPEWVRHYVAPGQKQIDKRISTRQKAILKEKKCLEKDEDKRIEARECLKLLYVGETELEPVVWNTLEKLGAKVERPKNPGKEDGWIFIKVGNWNHRGVLEIKSTKSNQFNEDGIGQLAKWKDRGIRLRNEKYKGIFIGNNCRDKPPSQRPCPFADDWRRSADMSEICALTTEYLYKIYLLKSSKKLDINAFWSDVFQTNGVFSIDKYFSGTIPKKDYLS